MAGSPRVGQSQWWTSIVDLALAAQATATDLYQNGINRLSDRTVWLRDAITLVRSDFANATAGTRATVVGSVDLSTLTYDPVTGPLNGLTLQLTADLGGTLTVTFGTGAGAPAGPADVVAQIVAVTSAHQGASEDAAGHLNLTSITTGGTSTITVTGGSAVTALGFTVAQNAAGAASGADGISRVSGAAITGVLGAPVPAGTLRAMLAYLADRVEAGTLVRAETATIIDTTNSPPFPCLPGAGSVQAAADFVTQTLLAAPTGASLLSVSWYLKAGTGAPHGGMPANKPTLVITKINIFTGASTTLSATVTDSSGSTAALDAAHAIIAPITLGNGPGGTSEIVDRQQYAYFATLHSESGANSLTTNVLMGAVSTFTR